MGENFCLKVRSVDSSGDTLPVLLSSAAVSGPEAVAAPVRDRLNLLTGTGMKSQDRPAFVRKRIKVFPNQ